MVRNAAAGPGGGICEEVIRVWDALAENSLLNSRRHPVKNIRWRYPARFPYRIIYEVTEDERTVVVAAVLHAARHDRRWRARLRTPSTRACVMILLKPAAIRHKGRDLFAHGNPALLNLPLEALHCSNACPGAKIIEAMDLAQRWRAENRAVVSGFHTAVEKECLRIFLCGPQPVVICPARGLDPFQLPADWQPKLERGELLILSPFDSSVRRATKGTAEARTRLVLDLASQHSILHASPGGLLDRLTKIEQT